MAKFISWLAAAAALLALPLTAATADCPSQPNQTVQLTCTSFCDAYGKDFNIKNQGLYQRLKGQIILKVQGNGEAYYVSPFSQKIIYLGHGQKALDVLLSQSSGITDAALRGLIPGTARSFGPDSDMDGLTDNYEQAIGTKPYNFNSDNDRYSDFLEVKSGFNPLGYGAWPINSAATEKLKGRVLLQVEDLGQSWYVNPKDGKRYLFTSQYDTDEMIRTIGTGISNYTFDLMVK